VAIVRVILDRVAVLYLRLDREVLAVEWVKRDNVSLVEGVVPGLHRRGETQRPQLISDRTYCEGRSDRNKQRNPKRASLGAQHVVGDYRAERMANDDGRFLGELARHDSIDLIAHTRTRRVEIDVSRKYLQRFAANAARVSVNRRQDGLHPLPVLGTL
jgi:hypothetical protein